TNHRAETTPTNNQHHPHNDSNTATIDHHQHEPKNVHNHLTVIAPPGTRLKPQVSFGYSGNYVIYIHRPPSTT
ncbi:hypothetical protein, partial [Corynebacterium sp. 20_84]